jgi:hypothetical protein
MENLNEQTPGEGSNVTATGDQWDIDRCISQGQYLEVIVPRCEEAGGLNITGWEETLSGLRRVVQALSDLATGARVIGLRWRGRIVRVCFAPLPQTEFPYADAGGRRDLDAVIEMLRAHTRACGPGSATANADLVDRALYELARGAERGIQVLLPVCAPMESEAKTVQPEFTASPSQPEPSSQSPSTPLVLPPAASIRPPRPPAKPLGQVVGIKTGHTGEYVIVDDAVAVRRSGPHPADGTQIKVNGELAFVGTIKRYEDQGRLPLGE